MLKFLPFILILGFIWMIVFFVDVLRIANGKITTDDRGLRIVVVFGLLYLLFSILYCGVVGYLGV